MNQEPIAFRDDITIKIDDKGKGWALRSRDYKGVWGVVENYKCDGSEGNEKAFAIVGDHENRPTDMTNVVAHKTDGIKYSVRRLTPMECERLQGYPDGWTDIGEWTDSKGKVRQTTDSARYKALGNSICLPVWKWVLKRISATYERDATMASLFDGIGGFPYLWEQLNGKGTCLWASEIEDFCVAVTERRINGE